MYLIKIHISFIPNMCKIASINKYLLYTVIVGIFSIIVSGELSLSGVHKNDTSLGEY